MQEYYWFSVFIGCNALLLFFLAVNVSLFRIKYKISVGDGGNQRLLKAIRAHANGIEQVPIFALLILALTYNTVSSVVLANFTIIFIVARLLHAIGMLSRFYLARRLGASATYFLQIAAILLLLVKVNG